VQLSASDLRFDFARRPLMTALLSLPPWPSPGINDLDKNFRQILEPVRLIRKFLSRRELGAVVSGQLSVAGAVLVDCNLIMAVRSFIKLSFLEIVISPLISFSWTVARAQTPAP